MKKIYLSIIAATIAFSANAQLTLTKAFNEPVLGDVNSKEIFDSVAVLNNSTGLNQVWNFSALTSSSVTEVGTFTTVASTPNGSNYAGATIVEDDGQSGFTYYKSTSTQYEIVGIEDPNIVLNFTNTAIAAIWPVTMGYSNTDLFAGSAAAGGTLTGTATGTTTTMGTGTGTLIIPGGASFTNILQVKTQQNVELNLAGGFITATVQTTDYNYYHGTQKFPLLTVSYSDVQGAFANTSATIKINNSVITGINDLNFDASFNIFPNPAKDYVNVKLHNAVNSNCKIQIVNSIGQIAQEIDLGNDSEITRNISVSNLNSGIYMVKTTLGNKVSVRKLIIE
ncbi:MAG: hypothetical protein C0448_05720 [Sphingobacteriaceae bacterium]|nr:hypothetical protein [Sphingobacteriaceae bacterium]